MYYNNYNEFRQNGQMKMSYSRLSLSEKQHGTFDAGAEIKLSLDLDQNSA